MKYITLFFAFLLFSNYVMSQVNVGGIPYSWKTNNFENENVPSIRFPNLDIDILEEEDRMDEANGLPPRFGYKHKVEINLMNSGIWKNIEDKRVWNLEVKCPNALSVNFLFDKFWLPQSGKFYIYNKDRSHLIGGFTAVNNKGTKEQIRGFGTGLVFGEDIILEYEQNISDVDPVISISNIVHGYRSIRNPNTEEAKFREFGDSGSCNVNVNCSPEGDDWQDEKTGIALILVDGDRHCTGSLINNTCNDGKLYFLTADHCLEIDDLDAATSTNADNWSFVWNYESSGCNNPSSEPSMFTTNGATLVANLGDSDFALFELDESPYSLNPAQKVFFNGWSRVISPLPNNVVGIHHPSGDIKKISSDFDAVIVSSAADNSNLPQSMLKVIDWDIGTTEGGSSGSPLFNSSGLIVGQLQGGTAACGNDFADFYGMINYSWSTDTSNLRQLKNWLNGCGSEVNELAGGYLDQCDLNVTVDYPIQNDLLIQSAGIIDGSSIVENPSNVEFKAGEMVKLTSGFHAENGCNFRAYINNCEPQFIPIQFIDVPDSGSKGENALYRSNENLFDVEIYPNPTDQILNVSYRTNVIDEANVTKLYITNVQGKIFGNFYCHPEKESLYKISLNVSDLQPGIYFITILNKHYKESLKFIKK